MVKFLETVEQRGRVNSKFARLCFFLIPKNVTSERPSALLSTPITWWEWLRARAVKRLQERRRFAWDATDERGGRCGAYGLGNFARNGKVSLTTEAIRLVLDLAKALSVFSPPSCVGVVDAFQFSPTRFRGCYMRVLRAPTTCPV